MADWIGINGSHKHSVCGEGDPGAGALADALNGTGWWAHNVATLPHTFVVDLGTPKEVQKVRGRNKQESFEPVDVNIYVSNDTGNWGTAVATGITTWADTATWVEIDTTDKTGRYVKVEVVETGLMDWISWGGVSEAWFAIFDVYAETPPTIVEPATLALALTLETPTVSAVITVEPSTLALALNQHAPGLRFDYTIQLDSALELGLALHAPTVFPIVTVTPESLALAVALLTPEVIFSSTITPDLFSLALAQHTPFAGAMTTVLIGSALELALALKPPTVLKNTVKWSAGFFTYQGITYEISTGSTQKKFIYWDPNYTTLFRSTDDLQDVLDAGGWIMCINESGLVSPVFARKIIHGGIIQAGTITAEFGQIADLAVSTLNIQDNAVTFPVSAYTSAGWVNGDIQEVTITTTGKPVVILASARIRGTGTQEIMTREFYLKLKRDTTEIYNSEACYVFCWNSDGYVLTGVVFKETPSAGTYTYKLNLTGTTIVGAKRFLFVMETKK